MNVFEILRAQKLVKDVPHTKLILVNSITTYLLEPTEDSFKELLKPLGGLLMTYHANLTPRSCIPIRVNKKDSDIMFMIPELIKNHNGVKSTLLPLLINLLSHYNNK